MNQPTNHISLLLLTHNESENLQKHWNWLGKCPVINEIVAVDDNSNDNTKDILKKLSSKERQVCIFDRGLAEDFAAQRNFGIKKCSNDWVFWLDADETPSDELISFINGFDFLQNHACSFHRRDIFLGKQLNHGETASQFFLRLFNKTQGKFEGMVHERWITNAMVEKRGECLFHYAHPKLYPFLNKINFYSDLRAKELDSQGVKSNLFQIIFYPLGKFILNYIFRLGFLDSTPGIILAISMSLHSFLVRSKLWHLQHS